MASVSLLFKKARNNIIIHIFSSSNKSFYSIKDTYTLVNALKLESVVESIVVNWLLLRTLQCKENFILSASKVLEF